jgi:hypothetical protein
MESKSEEEENPKISNPESNTADQSNMDTSKDEKTEESENIDEDVSEQAAPAWKEPTPDEIRARRLAKLGNASPRKERNSDQPREKIPKLQSIPSSPAKKPIKPKPTPTQVQNNQNFDKAASPMESIKGVFNVLYSIPELNGNTEPGRVSQIVSTVLARELYGFIAAEANQMEDGVKDSFDNFYVRPEGARANMMHYLVGVYQKCCVHGKRGDWTDGTVEVIKQQSISFGLLILKGGFGSDQESGSFGCLLGRLMLSMSFSQGFLPDLLYVMHADQEMNIFHVTTNDALTYIRIAAQLTVSKSEFALRPLQCLLELCSFVLPNTKIRPIATIMTEREDWLPTKFANEKQKANEIVSHDFLAPFLNFNIMDDKTMLDQYSDVTELGSTVRAQISAQLRTRLEAPRALMFQIVETILRNMPSRNAMITWLCRMAELNLKRAGMHVVETEVSSVSLILNILYISQQLTVKIDINKVDCNYIYHPACRTKPGNETTILAEVSQLETHLANLKLQNPSSPNFHTECFWITILYTHIGLVPITRRLTRTIKDLYQIIREIKRLRSAKPSSDQEKANQAMMMQQYNRQARIMLFQVICFEAFLFTESNLKSSVEQSAQFTEILMKLILNDSNYKPTSQGNVQH